MWRILVAIMAISLFYILPMGTATAYGCELSKSVYAANDNVQDTIIARSGTFAPCGSLMSWQDSFHRTSSNNGRYFLRFKYVGSIVYNQYDSDLYQQGNYTNSGSECAGGGTKEIIIGKSSKLSHGLWDTLTGQATFWESCPSEGPQGP